ncbi:MAG TPA: hypothetical protein VGU66_19030 [Candidatus Elarobacter sp.]|nr:hypothetical protein [Candidatus Elarobacter sp.]
MPAVTYNLTFVNNSSLAGSACVYQTAPDIGVQDVMSLAWFAKFTNPGTQATFSWQINYSFVWGQTGTLVPGVLFNASQVLPADLSLNNKTTLVYNGGFDFSPTTSGPNPGSLYIAENNTIPPNQASVGVGMSGAGTYVVQADPNLQLMFTPTPQYWITFGDYTQGVVMSIEEITSTANINFPPNTYEMVATLNADDTWTVGTTASANAEYLAARRKDRSAKWGRAAKVG